jgi:hypothetical protein
MGSVMRMEPSKASLLESVMVKEASKEAMELVWTVEDGAVGGGGAGQVCVGDDAVGGVLEGSRGILEEGRAIGGELDGHRHLHRWSKGRGRVVVVCFQRCALYFFLSFFALLCSPCVFVVPSSDQFFGMLYFMGSWGNKARQLRSVTHLFQS